MYNIYDNRLITFSTVLVFLTHVESPTNYFSLSLKIEIFYFITYWFNLIIITIIDRIILSKPCALYTSSHRHVSLTCAPDFFSPVTYETRVLGTVVPDYYSIVLLVFSPPTTQIHLTLRWWPKISWFNMVKFILES